MGEGKKVVVAVYGTLMRGESNERWAREAGAKVIGEGCVGGVLIDTCWGFPAIRPGGGCRVAVELLETDAEGLAHMDVLEGYPTLYRRETVEVLGADGKRICDALVYVMNETPPNARIVPPGPNGTADWRWYRKVRQNAERA